MKKISFYIIFIALLFSSASSLFGQNLIGVWGTSNNDNASFKINSDSIYYVESATSCKYIIKDDSIFINIDQDEVYKAKYTVRNDSLLLADEKETNVFVRITQGRITESGTFTMLPGFNYLTNSIKNYGGYAMFYFVFWPSSYMSVGTSYRVATIGENCWPFAIRVLSFTSGGNTWSVTVNPNGDVYARIVSGSGISGSPYPTNNVVSLGTLVYNY